MPASKTTKRKASTKKPVKKGNILHRIANRMPIQLLLFIGVFGALGVGYLAYSNAATQPSIYFDARNCKIFGRTGWHKPATAQLSGPHLMTVSARVSAPDGNYSLPTRNTAGRTVNIYGAKVVFRNYRDGKTYFSKSFNITSFSSRCK